MVAVFGGECFVVTMNDTKEIVEQTSRLLMVAVFGGECGGSQPGQLDLKEHHLDENASAATLSFATTCSLWIEPAEFFYTLIILILKQFLVWSHPYRLSTGSVGAPSGQKHIFPGLY